MSPSVNMQAVLVLCEHKGIEKVFAGKINIERDEIDWNKIAYGSLPGGYQVAVSWAYALFCDEVKNLEEFGYRDPFDGFSTMDRDIQVLVFKAMALRHGFVKLTLEDKPDSPFVKILKDLEAGMDKDHKKKNFTIVSSDDTGNKGGGEGSGG